jgi:hypothetical protein
MRVCPSWSIGILDDQGKAFGAARSFFL